MSSSSSSSAVKSISRYGAKLTKPGKKAVVKSSSLEIPWPKKVLLCATSHGERYVNDESQPYSFVLPDGLQIASLNSVAPGVCNYLHPAKKEQYMHIINLFLQSQDGANALDSSSPGAFLGLIQEILSEASLSEYDQMEEVKTYSKEELDELAGMGFFFTKRHQQFLDTKNKRFGMTVFDTAGQQVPDKLFIQFEPSDTIIALNVPGMPNLFDIFLEADENPSEIVTEGIPIAPGIPRIETPMFGRKKLLSLKQIADRLREKGVEIVELIDFSCHPYGKLNGDPLSDEEINLLIYGPSSSSSSSSSSRGSRSQGPSDATYSKGLPGGRRKTKKHGKKTRKRKTRKTRKNKTRKRKY